MNDLKYLLNNLPKLRKGRELTLQHCRSGYWYVGYPNLVGDFSIDLYADDKDLEGACLNLFYQIENQLQESEGKDEGRL